MCNAALFACGSIYLGPGKGHRANVFQLMPYFAWFLISFVRFRDLDLLEKSTKNTPCLLLPFTFSVCRKQQLCSIGNSNFFFLRVMSESISAASIPPGQTAGI